MSADEARDEADAQGHAALESLHADFDHMAARAHFLAAAEACQAIEDALRSASIGQDR